MRLYDLICARRTIRKFKQTELTKEQLKAYINAARLAPSGANLQPLKYVSIHSKNAVDAVFNEVKWAAYLAPNYTPKKDEVPTAYIAICVDTEISKAPCEVDIGLAAENMMLAALEDGVGSCMMGAINRENISAILNLPEHLTLAYVIALGFSAENPTDTEIQGDDVKYFLRDGRLTVPKRTLQEVLLAEV